MSSEFDKITQNGNTLFRRDWALIEAAGKAAGITPHVIQGGWNHGRVTQSAGTHDGGSVFDLSVRGLDDGQAIRLVVELRKRNCAAYLRNPHYGWPASLSGPHIHATVIDGRELSPAAADQNRAYLAGRNALASRLPDPFPRPTQQAYRFVTGLHQGSHGQPVKALQRVLQTKPVDGIFGPLTLSALHAWQAKNHLPITNTVTSQAAHRMGLH